MSASVTLPAAAEADLVRALLDRLRADAWMQAELGTPARIFDDESEAPSFPFLRLERHETRDAGSSCVPALDHRITLGLASRWGGRQFAKRVLGRVREVVEGEALSVAGQVVVLQQVVFSDVLRAADRRAFRGIIQIRIIAEEAA